MVGRTEDQILEHLRDFKHSPEVTLERPQVPIEVQQFSHESSVRHPLQQRVDEFLHSATSVLLLLGEAGCGMTTFCRSLEEQLISKFAARQQDTFPIRIELNNMTLEQTQRCVDDAFKQQYGLDETEITLLKRSAMGFVFIIDGLDKLIGNGSAKIYLENALDAWGHRRQVILTARKEYYIGENRKWDLIESDRGAVEFEEWHVAPLSVAQISPHVPEYRECIAVSPNISDLIRTPALLNVFLGAYPVLKQQDLSRISHADLYQAYLQTWTENDSVRRFLSNLAFDLYSQGLTMTENVNLKSLLDSESDLLMQPHSPLRFHLQGDRKQYYFPEQFLEFFVAEYMLTVLEHLDMRSSSSIHAALVCWDARLLTHHPSQGFTATPMVITLLVERIYKHPERAALEEKLYSFISLSKTREAAIQASSNAATLLSRLGPFTAKARQDPKFFHKARMPGANLPAVELSGVNMKDSDLSYAALSGNVDGAQFDGANLTGVTLPDYPAPQLVAAKNAINCRSKDGRFKFEIRGSEVKLSRLWGGAWLSTQTFREHHGGVNCASFSLDGRYLVSGGVDGTLWRQDISNVSKIRNKLIFRNTKSIIECVQSPDNRWVAFGDHARVLSLLPVRKPSASISRQYAHSIQQIVFAPDSRRVITIIANNTMHLLDVTHVDDAQFVGHQNRIVAAAISKDNRLVVSASEDCTIRLWMDNGAVCSIFKTSADWRIMSVGFSLDDRHVMADVDGDILTLWGMEENLPVQSVELLSQGHMGPVNSVDFSAGKVVSGGDDKTAHVWGPNGSVDAVYQHQAAVSGVAFSPDGAAIATSSGCEENLNGQIQIFDKEGELTLVYHCKYRHVSSVAFSPDGDWIAAGTDLGYKSGMLMISNSGVADSESSRAFDDHASGAVDVAFSPDHHWVASSGEDCAIQLRQVEGAHAAGSRLKGFGLCVWVRSIAFSPDSRWLVSGEHHARRSEEHGDAVKLWDLSTGMVKKQICRHVGGVSSVSFSPDGKWVASCGEDGVIKINKLQRSLCGTSSYELHGHKGGVNDIAFSRDGEQIASAGEDGTVRLWQKKSKGGKWYQFWQSPSDDGLRASGCSMKGVKGLSDAGQVMLKQQGVRKLTVKKDRSGSNPCPLVAQGIFLTRVGDNGAPAGNHERSPTLLTVSSV
ncbi:MAG: hypothetical protein K0U23_01920 [Gammaproteobacteria bacterium]|nr:hypothetical protein [Gammaproteobacteria bacterium]